MAETRTPTSVYQMKVTLRSIKPPVWRRFLMKDNATLRDLHWTIQDVMGWTNCHLHEFDIGGESFADDTEMVADGDALAEWRYKLRDLRLREKSRIAYTYDFGDGWEHLVTVEAILPLVRGERYPRCIAGKRACPPEDCGGPWGYPDLLEAIADPTHPDHDEMAEWVGADFDPERFDCAEVNELLDRGDQKARHLTADF